MADIKLSALWSDIVNYDKRKSSDQAEYSGKSNFNVTWWNDLI